MPERALGRFPPEVERGFVTRPSVLRTAPDVTSRPRADVSSRADVRVCDARGDVRPAIPVSLGAAMAAVPAIRPQAFAAGNRWCLDDDDIEDVVLFTSPGAVMRALTVTDYLFMF